MNWEETFAQMWKIRGVMWCVTENGIQDCTLRMAGSRIIYLTFSRYTEELIEESNGTKKRWAVAERIVSWQ